MKKKTKKEVRFDIITLSAGELEGDFSDLIPMITDTKAYLKKNHIYFYEKKKDEIEACYKFSFYHNICYDESDEFDIQGHRWETDEEFEDRIKKEKEEARIILNLQKQKKAEEYLKEMEIYEKVKKRLGE